MAMGTCGGTGAADYADLLSFFYFLPCGHCDFIHVPIKRFVTVAVVDDDAVAVSAVGTCFDYFSVACGLDGCSLRGREINAFVELHGVVDGVEAHSEAG